jgi:hypothetical protein
MASRISQTGSSISTRSGPIWQTRSRKPADPSDGLWSEIRSPGWERGWGPAAHPTLAVYLTGEAEIEASDGEIRSVGAGTVLLA